MVAKNSFVFTSKALEKLSIPVIKRSYYYDTTTRGLSLYVTAASVKKLFFYKRVHGRPERIIIGRINEVMLEQAREIRKRHDALTVGLYVTIRLRKKMACFSIVQLIVAYLGPVCWAP